MIKTPELDKLQEVKEEAKPVEEFIRFLRNPDNKYSLCKHVDDHHHYGRMYAPITESNIEKVMYEFFGIDYEKAEKERQQILEDLRNGT